jgi:gliding motility-associated-like protein
MMRGIFALLLCLSIHYISSAQSSTVESRPCDPMEGRVGSGITGLQAISIEASDCLHPTGTIEISVFETDEFFTYTLGNREAQTDPIFEDLASGDYVLYITDVRGCTFDTTLFIPRKTCPVYIPNVFSPNGDGVNDLFQIKVAGDENIIITRFFVFDRWGNNVYKKYNLRLQSDAEWWDGTYKHFTSSAGIFNYYLEVEFENGERETFKGNITLIR